MDNIVECVPNFSTSDSGIINEITNAIKSVKNVKLLNVEPDNDYNRVVVTFVGSPKTVGEAAFQAIAKATELIDMREHKGEHPRMGACDVTPFIPVKGVSMDECVSIAKSVAARVASELGVPTYLYGKAANSESRVKLSNIRKGEYEGFKEKIKDPEWKPDFGEAKFQPKSGAYTIGARDFLIAYNVNVDQEDVSIAKEVAVLVRESGRIVEKNGEKVREPGMLKGVQGMGFPLERDGRKLSQVSMNIVDFRKLAKLHETFELVKNLTEERGAKVTGSEIVGLVPLDAILEAGTFYAPETKDINKIIEIVIDKLGLSDLEPFLPNQKIIELMINEEKLVDLSINEFLNQLASNKPTPGGGSVSALGASLAASLGSMVANLTIGKEKYKEVQDEMMHAETKLSTIQKLLVQAIDEDTRAFNEVMDAFKMSRDNPEVRSQAIQKAMIHAAEVPLQVASLASESMGYILTVAEKGNKNAITDAGVAALFSEAAALGAIYNVRINLMSIKDKEIKNRINSKVTELTNKINGQKEQILKIVESEFS